MKYIIFLLFAFPWKIAAQWTDDFSDADFRTSPSWSGDTVKFTVNQSFQLQLNAPAVNGSAYLSTSSHVNYNASWTFLVRMGFNPSSGNYAKVYLISDQADLTLPLHGYYLRIGGANDDLCLFRKEGDEETQIAGSRDKIFNSSAVCARIRVTRDSDNNWELFCDSTGGILYRLLASVTDGNILNSSYFGIQCIYTSTRSNKFYFDDFVVAGEVYQGPTPSADSTHLFDVVFNEIMADPAPVVGLPESEYLELYNRSGKQIDMTNWKLTVGSKLFMVPNVQIPDNQYLIISSKSDTSRLSLYGRTLGLFTSTTTLNNTGEYLRLENREGRLIHWLEYTDFWYKDDFKAQGGWSLEQIDPLNPCGGKENWKVSTDRKGGTPGSRNSVYAENFDNSVPDLISINVPNDSVIQILFSEPLDSTFATNISNYYIEPYIGVPGHALVFNKSYSSIQLLLNNKLMPGLIYTLRISKNIMDCTGHQLLQDISTSVGLPVAPDSSNLVINEVLFNARTGGADYAELYNRSTKMINARDLLIGTRIDGKVANLCRLSENGFLIRPLSYLVVSADCEKVKPFYFIKDERCFVDLPCMPSLDDKASTLVLLNDTFGRIDEFAYSEKMHFPTLKNLEGISLERVSPDRSSYFPGNWHSAAEIDGYGTPGYKNSQYLGDSVNINNIVLSCDILSPDNDGYNDILQVSYKFNETGCRAQVLIFDVSGRLVRRLLNNELLGTQGAFTWDGTNDMGRLCNVGLYVIFIQTVFEDGTIKEYKKPCVLALKR